MKISAVPRIARSHLESASLVESGARALAATSWIYAVVMALALEFVGWRPDTKDLLTDVVAVPVNCVAMILICLLLFRRSDTSGPQRRVWWVILAFTAMNLVANDVWNHLPPSGAKAFLTYADGLYLLDYWILTAAFALLFVSVGGSLRRPLVWLDIVTMILVQLVGLWTVLVAPQVSFGIDRHASVPVIVGYSFTFAAMTSMAAVLWMQTRSTQGRAPTLLLIGAVGCEAAWEVIWLASWLSNGDFAGSYYNFGDMLCFCCIGSAAVLTQGRGPRKSSAANPERSVESFLPALVALLAIATVAGSVAATRRSEALMLVGLVLLCAALVLTRQRSVRKELQAMSKALATRDADARLTELVRRSAELMLVVDEEGTIGFASPASQAMLSITPASLQGTRAAELLGPAHAAQLTSLLEDLKNGPVAPGVIELRHLQPAGSDRTIKVSGSNQLDNPLINGLVLTVTDVTEQRALERAVLDVATCECARLCGDIHDGLGQELAGIAMLLQGAATLPNPDPAVHKTHLKSIIGHVNRSIQIARDLARGLSPLHVVRGSLSGALRRLADENSSRKPVHLWVDAEIGARDLDDLSTDHLYRIAHEAVNNAVSHSSCSHVEIALRLEQSGLVMRIAADGTGFESRSDDFPGLGLKLMEYRTRLLGGAFRVEHLSNAGTHIVVTIPRRPAADDGLVMTAQYRTVRQSI